MGHLHGCIRKENYKNKIKTNNDIIIAEKLIFIDTFYSTKSKPPLLKNKTKWNFSPSFVTSVLFHNFTPQNDFRHFCINILHDVNIWGKYRYKRNSLLCLYIFKAEDPFFCYSISFETLRKDEMKSTLSLKDCTVSYTERQIQESSPK